MDPSIMKLLEEDEDETMHSGADVEAFTAALNRDIEGDASLSQPSDSDSAVASQGNPQTSSQLLLRWQTSSTDGMASSQNQKELKNMQQQEQPSAELEPNQLDVEDQQPQAIDTLQQPDHLLNQKESLDNLKKHHTEQRLAQFSHSTEMQIPNIHTEQMASQLSQPSVTHISENDSVQSTLAMNLKTQEDDQQWKEPNTLQFPQVKGVQIAERNPIFNAESQYSTLGMNKDMTTPLRQVSNLASQMASQLSQPSVTHISENDSVQSTLAMNHKTQEDDQRWKEPNTLQFPQVKGVQIAERNSIFSTESQYSTLGMNKDTTTPLRQVNNLVIPRKQVSFGMLLPEILPQLDKDRAMQLQTLYAKLKKNEIPKDGFMRHMKAIVGDQRLKLAVIKSCQSHASAETHFLKMASNSPQQPHGSHSFAQLHQKENGSQTSQETEQRSNSQAMLVGPGSNTINQERDLSTSSIQGLARRQQQQQHFHFPDSSFPTHHPYPGTNVSAPASSPMPQSLDSQVRNVPLHQSKGQFLLGGSTQGMNAVSLPKLERQNSINDPKKSRVASLSNFSSSSALTSTERGNAVLYVKEEPAEQNYEQHQVTRLPASQGSTSFPVVQIEQKIEHASLEKRSSKMVSTTSTSTLLSNPVSSSLPMQMEHNAVFNSQIIPTTSPDGTNVKTPPKKAFSNQKKPLEAPSLSPPLSNKKQKVSGAFADQSIEQLNDVTAVSGVNLREEEEQMFSGTKDGNRVSELSRKVVKEEEEKLILQRIPLQKKLASIMMKCGITNISNDVERCLSLCVEERLRGLVSNLIRLSKQRVNHEKSRHRSFINSDVGQQILIINQKAREEYEKKYGEENKHRRPHDSEDNFGVDGSDKEKDDGRSKSVKKGDDEKMRATAANVAARAAAGGDDMLSKWQLMAEQSQHKRLGGREVGRPSGRNGQEAPAPTASAEGVTRDKARLGRGSVSVKDVIATLEREVQMSKSALIYRLYQKAGADGAAD